MGKRTRRTRTAHPGVKLKQVIHRSGATGWVARYIDPDTGKERQEGLEQYGVTSEPARREWAITKSEHLKKRKRDLVGGAAPHTGESLEEAIESYFSTKGERLEDSTAANYRAATDRLLEWAAAARVLKADDLHPHHLGAFCDWLAAQPAKTPVTGGLRGERVRSDRKCSAGGINNRLRAIKAVLNKLRKTGRLPHITSDAIKDGIELEDMDKPRPAFLRPTQIKLLLRAVLRHDAATFAMTREEKTEGAMGRTPKHPPIGPFVVFVLLTGCRVEEGLAITWSAIDLDAKGDTGKKVGEIYLSADMVKTGHERVVDLGVCPALRKILTSLKLRAGSAPYVFGGDAPWTRTKIDDARDRLVKTYGAPAFTWSQREGSGPESKPPLRATCGTFLTNAPGIYGAASAFHAAKRLGHSVTIAERHYVGLVRGIPKKATTLDAAMEIEKELAEITARLTGGKVGRTNDSGEAATIQVVGE